MAKKSSDKKGEFLVKTLEALTFSEVNFLKLGMSRCDLSQRSEDSYGLVFSITKLELCELLDSVPEAIYKDALALYHSLGQKPLEAFDSDGRSLTNWLLQMAFCQASEVFSFKFNVRIFDIFRDGVQFDVESLDIN